METTRPLQALLHDVYNGKAHELDDEDLRWLDTNPSEVGEMAVHLGMTDAIGRIHWAIGYEAGQRLVSRPITQER